MAISIADVSGPPSCPFFLMPDLKKASPVKQSLFHRFGFRKWLARDDRISEPHSQFEFQDTGLGPRNVKDYFNSNISNGKYDTNYADIFRPTDFDFNLPRPSTHRRQNSEYRDKPATSYSLGHRRAASVDRGSALSLHRTGSPLNFPARLSAPALPWDDGKSDSVSDVVRSCPPDHSGSGSNTTTSDCGDGFDDALERQLDKIWILNLSMRFRDKADREKFFVTYVEAPNRLRKLTITCDYSDAEPGSLEEDLNQLQYHREKSAQIYESICDSISQIEFFDTVTNLRLETRDGQLHVHVTEDLNEIITYPPLMSVDYLDPVYIPESELDFESHLSGFVYRVKYQGKEFVKKEITGPDTIEEFLYEINALHALGDSKGVIDFKAIVVDDTKTVVKGLLIEDAEKGSLADIFYDFKGTLSWERRERWAKQIIGGLADIHEAGFVQGDFTVSNVVVDQNDDAQIIDINRRGCPIGWEPPEFIPKLDSKQRISMFIGVKSDLFQLGMTLWAIAMEDDEPGRQLRPLHIPIEMKVPDYYCDIVQICLSDKPRDRLSAKDLLTLFPKEQHRTSLEDDMSRGGDYDLLNEPPRYRSVDTDLQHTNPALLEEEVHAQRFASLPYSHSSLEDGIFDQQAPIPSPISGPLIGNSVNPSYTRFKSYDTNLPNGYNPVPANQLYLAQGHSTQLDEGYPRDQPSSPFLALDNAQTHTQRNTATADSNAPIFEAQNAEFDLMPPPGGLSSLDHPGNIGNHPTGAYGVPQLLTGVGTHPLCSFNSQYITTGENLTKPDTLSVSDILYHISSEHPELEGSPVDSAQSHLHQTERRIPDSVPLLMDLLSSRLPINPAHEPLEELQRATSIESLGDHHTPGLPLLSNPSIVSDVDSPYDLFTSRLPINPAHKPLEELRYTARLDDNDSHRLPVPPGPFDVPNVSDIDNLLCSKLPINPAHESLEALRDTAQINGHHNPRLPVTPDPSIMPNRCGIDDLLSSRLPINPALGPIEEFRHTAKPNDHNSPLLSATPDLSIVPSYYELDDLQNSRLPINPAHESTEEIRCSISNERLGDCHSPRWSMPPSSSIISKARDTDDLVTSNLPLNPAFIPSEEPGTSILDKNLASFRKMRSAVSLNKSYSPAIISEDIFLSRLSVNPANSLSRSLDLTNSQEPRRPSGIDNLFRSNLPINPSFDKEIVSPIVPDPMDLFSSDLPINPARNPLSPSLRPKRGFQAVHIFSGIDDLLTSTLPLNPRNRDSRFLGFNDLLSSRLPINPWIKAPSTTASSSSVHKSHAPFSKPYAPTIDSDLLTSDLPINPAFLAYNDPFIFPKFSNPASKIMPSS